MLRFDRMSYLMAPALIGAFSVWVFLACGGSEVEESPRPLCWASHPPLDGGLLPNLNSEQWIDLVVRNYHEGQSSTQTCIGTNVEWTPTDENCDIHEDEDEDEPEAVRLDEERVVVGRSDEVARKPVWVITHEFEDGDGFGPVMLTERLEQGVAVRAVGTLRMPMERARLRLRETGGQELIVADGERCPEEDDEQAGTPRTAGAEPEEGEEEEEETCLRYARLLPVVGDRIMTSEVRSRDGARCLAPAQVWLARERTVALENGWERTFRLAASMEFRAGAVIVHEQVTAEDKDPRDPGRPARTFRTSDADRTIYLRRGGMRSRGIPLFERALRAHGSTQLPIAEAR